MKKNEKSDVRLYLRQTDDQSVQSGNVIAILALTEDQVNVNVRFTESNENVYIFGPTSTFDDIARKLEFNVREETVGVPLYHQDELPIFLAFKVIYYASMIMDIHFLPKGEDKCIKISKNESRMNILAKLPNKEVYVWIPRDESQYISAARFGKHVLNEGFDIKILSVRNRNYSVKYPARSAITMEEIIASMDKIVNSKSTINIPTPSYQEKNYEFGHPKSNLGFWIRSKLKNFW